MLANFVYSVLAAEGIFRNFAAGSSRGEEQMFGLNFYGWGLDGDIKSKKKKALRKSVFKQSKKFNWCFNELSLFSSTFEMIEILKYGTSYPNLGSLTLCQTERDISEKELKCLNVLFEQIEEIVRVSCVFSNKVSQLKLEYIRNLLQNVPSIKFLAIEAENLEENFAMTSFLDFPNVSTVKVCSEYNGSLNLPSNAAQKQMKSCRLMVTGFQHIKSIEIQLDLISVCDILRFIETNINCLFLISHLDALNFLDLLRAALRFKSRGDVGGEDEYIESCAYVEVEHNIRIGKFKMNLSDTLSMAKQLNDQAKTDLRLTGYNTYVEKYFDHMTLLRF